MGDLFRQRRAAAASSSSSSTRLTPIISSSNIPSSGFGSSQPAVSQAPPSASSGRKSFAEIQREQEIAQQHQKQQRQQQQQSNTQQRQQYNVVQRQSVDEYGRLVRPSAAGDRGSSNSYSRGDPRSYDGPRGGGGGGDRYSSSGGGGSSRRGTNNSIHNSREFSNRSSLPTEQGVIHTLLDKFGFIRCADRPIEVFFHYSEYKEGHSDDLNIGDEVEFKIGKAEDRNRRTGDDKLSAFDVSRLPEGTVYWEKEDEPVGKRWRGVIDQSAREQRSSGGGPGRNSSRNGPSSAAVDGAIRIVNEDDNEENSSEMEQLEIYYSSSDYLPTKNSNTGRITGPSRLDRKDIVEFTLVTERRTGKKYARSITLIQSERERQRIEHEAKLLANAKLEEGKVVTITRDFGFIQSSSRLEQVYFHESNILPLDNDENENGTSSGINLLKEGQDVQFYVIGNEGGKNGKSVSARKIKILPKGSVKFEHVIAQGVTGLVVDCPVQAVVGFDRDRRGSGKSQQTTMGRIRLHNVIGQNREGEEEDQAITEVLLHPDMYPGGTFAISRTGSEVGCWIRSGDVLLFDVVQKVIDGSCHAMPTKSIRRRSDANDDESTSVKDDVESASTNNTTNKPCIHLIETTLCGRAQGIVRSIHDNNYGFIQLVERGVDAYFPLYEVFPSDIQADLVRDNPALYHSDDLNNLIQSKGGRINIEVGMEVEFDLSLQMLATQAGAGGGGGRYKQQNSRGPVQGKESLRGRRIQILPKGSVKEKISVASEVKATVIKAGDTKHQYVGTIQLEESLKADTVSKCHPLVARLLDGIIQGRYGSENVVFHDVISERDAQIVITMVNANDDLEWNYIDEKMTGNGHNRKLCIKKKKNINNELENLTLEAVEASATSDGAAATEERGIDDTKEATSPERKKPTHKSKKGSKKTKVVKTLRFEKYSFPDITIDPLLVGDVLTCDIFQSRKSGSFLVENINVIERKERPVVVSESKGGKSLGFVSEVVPSRHFGFITVVNSEGTKGEHVFFHFRDVDQSNKSGRKDVVMRGNEVQFDSAPGKNGKNCATNITFLPQGTLKLPVKANNNSPSCTGYILIEPSHTSLVNTPSHALTMQNGPAAASAGGRWANVKDDKFANVSGSNAKEGGVILLLSDPSHLFTPKPPVVTDKDSEESKSAGESNPTDSDETTKTDTKIVKQSTLVGPMTHIRYNLSSLAPRSLSNGRSDPKRGDLVTFSKARGANLVKDIKVQKTADAISVKGSLTDIDIKNDTAVLVTTLENNETKKYDISLSEVVSCEKTLLKDQEQCDGILHEGQIYGGE